jgi:hypothetical protein
MVETKYDEVVVFEEGSGGGALSDDLVDKMEDEWEDVLEKVTTGGEQTAMPRYRQPWAGLPEGAHLKTSRGVPSVISKIRLRSLKAFSRAYPVSMCSVRHVSVFECGPEGEALVLPLPCSWATRWASFRRARRMGHSPTPSNRPPTPQTSR